MVTSEHMLRLIAPWSSQERLGNDDDCALFELIHMEPAAWRDKHLCRSAGINVVVGGPNGDLTR